MAAAAAAQPEHLVVGHITKPHGTKGEVFVWPLTDEPATLFVEGVALLLGDEEGRPADAADELVIERSRPFKRGMLVKFDGLDDRDAVSELGGRYLVAALDMLRPLEEGELFYHQLLGAAVETVAGERVGTVREVFDTAPAHLLEVKSAEGKLHLIPYIARIVKEVDAESRRIVIDPPPGLLEL